MKLLSISVLFGISFPTFPSNIDLNANLLKNLNRELKTEINHLETLQRLELVQKIKIPEDLKKEDNKKVSDADKSNKSLESNLDLPGDLFNAYGAKKRRAIFDDGSREIDKTPKKRLRKR